MSHRLRGEGGADRHQRGEAAAGGIYTGAAGAHHNPRAQRARQTYAPSGPRPVNPRTRRVRQPSGPKGPSISSWTMVFLPFFFASNIYPSARAMMESMVSPSLAAVIPTDMVTWRGPES